MKYVNKQVLSGVDTGSVTGSTIDASQLISASFQIVFGDVSAAGTFKIQGSNDPVIYGNLPDQFTVTNWSDLPNITTSVASGVGAPLIITQSCYRWLRAVYTRSGGGSTTVVVNMFGISI